MNSQATPLGEGHVVAGASRRPGAATGDKGLGEPTAAAPRATTRCPVEPRNRPVRILVAEDDAEMRQILAETLRGDGYEVIELADGGRLLVDIATRVKGDGEGVDLIVSDIHMPVCTGLQILEALRQARWRTPVILITAFGDSATRRRAQSLMAVLFDKPFDLDDLRTAINNLLQRDRSVR